MFNKNQSGNIIYYTSPILEKYGFGHIFCTRCGGVSTGDFDSLNVSLTRKNQDGFTDKATNVAENFRRAFEVLNALPQKAVGSNQIHSDIVLEVTQNDAGKGVEIDKPLMEGCDGLILRSTNQNVDAVCVKTADCVPILLADIKTGDVCAVHAGWRGSAADIVSKAALKLSGGKTQNIIAAIGPCIGSCCYEIGDEVYLAFCTLFRSKEYNYDMGNIFRLIACCTANPPKHLDLAYANAELLRLCGVNEENIDIAGLCTCCKKDGNGVREFFSHRGQKGHSGTFISAISPKNKSTKWQNSCQQPNF